MKNIRFGMLISAGLVLAGCNNNAPKTFDQAGSVSFTVSALSPFSQVASGMSPNFSAKADGLVATTFAATEWQQSQFLQALGVSAGLTLPGGTLPSTGAPVASLPTAASPTPTGPEGVDPLLQYEAARNLYQSIQLMNHEMQLIASGNCYAPYLVMAKLSVVPNRIDVPDAIQSRVSFYPNPDELNGDTNETGVMDGCDEPGWLPRVVPILASDDLERAVRADSAEVATQISLAVAGVIHGVGGSVGANHLNETLNAINGSDFNDRMTVYREADNTIGIRINPSFDIGNGAINPKDADRELIGQNYDLALILLVPKAFINPGTATSQNTKYIESIMTTNFVDPASGQELPNKSQQKLGEETKLLLASALQGSESGQDLPATPAFTALKQNYVQLGDESWARIGHALIYLSQTDQYDRLSDIVLAVGKFKDYENYYLTCKAFPFNKTGVLTYANRNMFGLPEDLQLDDASTCFVLTAGWALNDKTADFSPELAAKATGQDPNQATDSYLSAGFLTAVWSGASQLADEEPVQIALTPLPDSNFLQLPAWGDAPPDVILVKDSSNNLNGTFAPVYLSSDAPVSVALTLNQPAGAGGPATLYSIASLDPNDPTNHTLTFSFPNAATLGRKDGTVAGKISFTLFAAEGVPDTQRCITDTSPEAAAVAPSKCQSLNAIIVSAPKPANTAGAPAGGNSKHATFALINPPSQVVVGPRGTGRVTLVFSSFTDSKVTLSTDAGGDVDAESLSTSAAVSGTALSISGDTLIISPPGAPPTKQAPLSIDVPLHNLKSGRTVKLTLTGSAAKQPTSVTLPLTVSASH